MDKQKIPETTQCSDNEQIRLHFGSSLRQAREQAGYSVEELAYASKIVPNFIESLELGQLERLPGEVFCRGFVRSLCKILNVDSQTYLKQLNECFESGDKENSLAILGSPGAERVRFGNERKDGMISATGENIRSLFSNISARHLGIGSAILFVVAGFIFLVSKLNQSALENQNNKSAQTSTSEQVAPTVAEGQDIEVVETSESDGVKEGIEAQSSDATGFASIPVQDSANNETQLPSEDKGASLSERSAQEYQLTASDSGEQALEIRVKEAVNMRVNIDKAGWETKKYEPQTYTFKFKDEVGLLIFDASAVDIIYNGKSLGSLGTKGRVRRLSFVNKIPELKNSEKL